MRYKGIQGFNTMRAYRGPQLTEQSTGISATIAVGDQALCQTLVGMLRVSTPKRRSAAGDRNNSVRVIQLHVDAVRKIIQRDGVRSAINALGLRHDK